MSGTWLSRSVNTGTVMSESMPNSSRTVAVRCGSSVSRGSGRASSGEVMWVRLAQRDGVVETCAPSQGLIDRIGRN